MWNPDLSYLFTQSDSEPEGQHVCHLIPFLLFLCVQRKSLDLNLPTATAPSRGKTLPTPVQVEFTHSRDYETFLNLVLTCFIWLRFVLKRVYMWRVLTENTNIIVWLYKPLILIVQYTVCSNAQGFTLNLLHLNWKAACKLLCFWCWRWFYYLQVFNKVIR